MQPMEQMQRTEQDHRFEDVLSKQDETMARQESQSQPRQTSERECEQPAHSETRAVTESEERPHAEEPTQNEETSYALGTRDQKRARTPRLTKALMAANMMRNRSVSKGTEVQSHDAYRLGQHTGTEADGEKTKHRGNRRRAATSTLAFLGRQTSSDGTAKKATRMPSLKAGSGTNAAKRAQGADSGTAQRNTHANNVAASAPNATPAEAAASPAQQARAAQAAAESAHIPPPPNAEPPGMKRPLHLSELKVDRLGSLIQAVSPGSTTSLTSSAVQAVTGAPDPQVVAERLVQQVETVLANRASTHQRMSLDLGAAGRVNVDVQMGAKLQIVLEPASADAAKFLKQGLASVTEGLIQRGYVDPTVEVRDSNSTKSNDQSQTSQEEHQNSPGEHHDDEALKAAFSRRINDKNQPNPETPQRRRTGLHVVA
jgi:hypothetical protein